MAGNMKKRPSFATLLLKALFPRFLFLGHGLLCIWIVSNQEQDKRFWYLLICLFLLVFEGLFNAIVRHGKEFHLFCPSAFLYCIVLITTISFLRERQIRCLINGSCSFVFTGDDVITRAFGKWPYFKRITIIEQTGLLVLIIGRWLLPSGSISREQFSQILLIYIGTAADIVEFNEIYTNDVIQDVVKVGGADKLLHGVMAVWALAVLQFSFTIILPEEGLKHEEKEEPVKLEKIGYFSKIKTNRVAPMSYMHYKSMLRDEFQDTSEFVSMQKDPVQIQNAFCQKYSDVSKTLSAVINSNIENDQSVSINIKDKTNINEVTFSPRFKPEERYSSSSYITQKTVSMPNGLRNPQNIGSPPFFKRSYSPIASQSSPSIMRSIGTKNEFKIPYKISNLSCSKSDILKLNQSNKHIKSKRKDSDQEDNSLGIGKNEIKNCFVKHIEFLGILLALCMQDGPFFIFRFVLIARYQVVTEMIILLTVKNALVIIVQVYRMINLNCTEPKHDEVDVEDASHRVRNAIQQNERMSSKLSLKRQRAGLALTALARMQMLSRDNPTAKQNRESSKCEEQVHHDNTT